MERGKIYKVPCSCIRGVIYCKTMPWSIDNFFYFPNDVNIDEIVFGSIAFFYSNWVNTRLYKSFQFIRKEDITDHERNTIPSFFRQDYVDLHYCHLIIPGQPDAIPCKPEDCIGLEREGVFDNLESLCDALISKITGKPTRDYEAMRLRLPGIDESFFDYQSKNKRG